MRISKIKLAGFKSFVDPTTLHLPGNLTGIVGPNGCGKSNIIDALQWVLGESSAKHLRGDSMADVVFNGSSSRKPVGQASVEIVFDNSDGGLGGQWASFTEIAIKRMVNRDGVSAYYLNGARSRRRDITDIFLGTGVGSHGYSVIAQGMISRVIEAKPEDLRLFLEEAAGISKYKERRRETESRMQKAAENLARLSDIRVELEKQLARLQQQAHAAEKYQTLKDEERRVSADLIVLSWRTFEHERETQALLAAQKETALEGAVARLRAVEARIEMERERHVAATQMFNDVQARFYAAGADIARAEQGLQYGKERRSTLQREFTQAETDRTVAAERAASEERELERIIEQVCVREPEHMTLLAEEAGFSAGLQAAEEAMQLWQEEWDKFNAKTTDALRDERGELTRVEHLEGSLGRLTHRLQTLQDETTSLVLDELQLNVAELADRRERLQLSAEQLAKQRSENQATIDTLRNSLEQKSRELDGTRSERQTVGGRLAALDALQQAAFAVDSAQLQDWLQRNELAEQPRVAQGLTVESGWDVAIETVLGSYLDGIGVKDIDPLASGAFALQSGSLTLIEQSMPNAAAASLDNRRLLSKVTGAEFLSHALANIYAAESLDEALALRHTLQPGESVILQDGSWLGPNWLRVSRSVDARHGVLQREQEIKQLRARDVELEEHLTAQESGVDDVKTLIAAQTGIGERLQTELNTLQAEITRLHGEYSSKQTQFEQATLRRERIVAEIAEIESRCQLEQNELQEVATALNRIRTTIKIGEDQRARLTAQRETLRAGLQTARESWSTTRERGHSLALALEALRSQKSALERSLQHNRERAAQLHQRCTELQAALAESDLPLAELQNDLSAALEKRVVVESELAEARTMLQSIDETVRNAERERTACTNDLDALRSELEAARVQSESLQVRLQGFREQLDALGFEIEPVLNALPEELNRTQLEEQLASLERRIARLGPINLAAIDECKDLEERKAYLDSQHDDLTLALTTLEGAIREIDEETKTRFNETFEKVNKGFQQKFPALFGGGQASLELTGDDLLETGVTVMARPPGKRNSTIHLLSGGEKALTAVALVFSIFELNPAPFCLLDEVDAPLDDANVVHLCSMLREMSQQVQFLFITHNKITMEIAERLVGVTMHEPGVSRLVAVDVNDAVKLAATG